MPAAAPAEADLPAFWSAARVLLGERFGGGWYLPGGNGTVAVGIVGPTAGDKKALEPFVPKGMALQIADFKYSEEALSNFLAIIKPVLESVALDTVFSFGPRPELNKIGITLLKEDNDLVAQLSTLAPADALEIDVSPGSTAETADSRATYPPYRAGRQVNDVNAPGC